MAEFLTGRERLAHAAAIGRWSMDPRPADARKIADQAGAVLAERNQLAEQLEAEAAVQALHRDARDRVTADLDRLTSGLRKLAARCEQGARDNGEYYERTAAKYEHGKAVVWDAVATELRALLAALDGTEPGKEETRG